MKRGFPRPQMHVAQTVTNGAVTAEGDEPDGSYGSKWNGRTYPVPYTAMESSISTLHSGRLRECVYDSECIVCGLPVETEIVTVMYMKNKIFSESGPFHDKCAVLTQKLCPHININSTYTFAKVAWVDVQDEILAMV